MKRRYEVYLEDVLVYEGNKVDRNDSVINFITKIGRILGIEEFNTRTALSYPDEDTYLEETYLWRRK